jgi:trimethylamine--corrinoid protein Co-methyltransferase
MKVRCILELIGIKVQRFVNILFPDEISQIHEASLRVLEEIGVVIQDYEILKLLEENGASVNMKNKLAKLPSDLIMNSLKSAPSEYRLYNRNGDDYAIIGGNGLVSRSTMSGTFLIDSQNRTRRPAIKKDVENVVKFMESLKNIHLSGPGCIPQDVDQRVVDLYMWLPQFLYANKPLGSTYALSVKTARTIFKMANLVYGEEEVSKKPRIRYYVFEPRSPLVYESLSLKIMKEFANRNYPIMIAPMPIAGLTAPITIAGSLVLHNAENLVGVVITQVLRRGVPVSIGGGPCVSDPRTGLFLWASPERVLMNIAYGQISQYYKLPSFVYAWHTESCVSDSQAAFEKTYLSFPAMISGYNEAIGVGSLGSESFSFQQAVLDDEFLDSIFRIVKGFEINNETIAFDAIMRAGQGGNYISDKHTLQHLRKEIRALSKNSVFNVRRWEDWEKKNKRITVEKANNKAHKLLSDSYAELVSHDVKKELENIMKSSEKDICK